MKNNWNKSNLIQSLRSLVSLYKSDGYIDDDCKAYIYTADGLQVYPDDVSNLKINGAKNIVLFTADDSMDFNHDFLGDSESFEFVKNISNYDYKNPLITDDLDGYFKTFEH